MNNIWKLAQECGFDDYELIPMLENFASKLAALQSAQPAAAVSDDDLQAIDDAHNWQTLKGRMAAYRAILALRPQADHPDTARCIKARNDLNAALHGEGALIDDLEHAVANVCAKLLRPAAQAEEREGFALVPVKPTPEMIRCAEMWDDGFEGAYARMLAAAQAKGGV